MTQENGNKLKDLGWISVKDEMPPLGEEINVCQADDYTQAIWRQTFKSEDEVRNMKITHWGRISKKNMTLIYCILCFGAGFFFGVFATALVVFSGDKTKRNED